MKITVCELPNDTTAFEIAWRQFVEHVNQHNSEVVLLPEMPFSPWLAQTREVNTHLWEESVENHNKWIARLDELTPAIVISTRPITTGGRRNNLGYIWEPGIGMQDGHAKYYLPDEPGYGKRRGINGAMDSSLL